MESTFTKFQSPSILLPGWNIWNRNYLGIGTGNEETLYRQTSTDCNILSCAQNVCVWSLVVFILQDGTS